MPSMALKTKKKSPPAHLLATLHLSFIISSQLNNKNYENWAYKCPQRTLKLIFFRLLRNYLPIYNYHIHFNDKNQPTDALNRIETPQISNAVHLLASSHV